MHCIDLGFHARPNIIEWFRCGGVSDTTDICIHLFTMQLQQTTVKCRYAVHVWGDIGSYAVGK